MEVLLVKPVNYSHQIVPPLGLGYLATALTKTDHKVNILDCIKKQMDMDGFREYVSRNVPEVIGFQTFSYDMKNVRAQIEIVKKINPDAVAIVGGPHPSAVPEETLNENPQIDFAFAGEAETGLPALIDLLEKKKSDFENVPGLVWRNDGQVTVNTPAFVEDLDSLGFPRWDMLIPAEYPVAVSGFFYKNFPIAPIIATRGCPYQCTFCGGRSVSGWKIRRRSPSNVLAELELLKHEYGVREFQILDDNFTSKKEYVVEICDGIISRKLNMTWCLPNGIRIDTLDLEVLKRMKKAGCYEFAIGIESGSQRVLDHMKKHLTIEKIRQEVGLISRVGINVNGFFIIGYPWSDRSDIKKTIKFAVELDLLRANFTNFLPLPNTEATRTLQKEGVLGKVNWSDMFYAKTVFPPKGMRKPELKRWQRKAFVRFYLRPKQILRMLTDIKSFKHLKIILRRSFDFLFMR